ncbi:nucleolar protein NAN1 [Suhomyces tanzawaensis NRRL Y-17324]|uniref:Nucleolar protein NAN1 n=1 Tax=Suhomyces tanzawaensis NRRL Y-17324 TaxID=984487 RepID=A0A1E4SFV2_9ASCO|nr:nucleolar protein NAN1 [Suhomyces tanzawaensis NRRL Y-17324]ODV78387.1 nucleolar protein NAN1 [Suhomyces tanzawaensis NRRL Y-17324]
MSGSTDWTTSLVSGGKPAFLPNSRAASTVFSADGRHCIVLLSHQLRVYFISTRQCIRAIECDATDVVDFKLDTTHNHRVLLFKGYGEVVMVNWRDKITVPIVGKLDLEVEAPILSVIQVTEDAFYTVNGKKDKKGTAQNRSIHKIDRNSLEITPLKEIENSTRFSISLDGSKIAFVNEEHEIYLVNFELVEAENSLASINLTTERIKFPFKAPVTSMAVSNDSIIALGTVSGTIQLLYGGLIVDKPQRLFKWHNDQVKSLQFTPDNAYLLSGGLEKVLVFWQLETEKTQFLPRLNGTIDKISIDNVKPDYYELLLKVSGDEEEQENTYEVLVLSAVDLVSRLSVNSIRPKFTNSIKSTLSKSKKKFSKAQFDVSKLRYDYSSIFEVHPKSKNLYFPNSSIVQAYDLVKNEQSFIQNAASTVSTGKVKSETKLADPEITSISFTKDGEWMCTFDSILTSDFDNLLSKGDKQYALKFWKYVEPKGSSNVKSTANGNWELTTKIIDPHGSNPIISIIPSPVSYYNGQAFVTVDSKGSLRLWRPRTTKEFTAKAERLTQTAWTLRKSKLGGSLASSSIDICWSDDGSLLILGHESSISVINVQTFEPVKFNIPAISGSPIRSLSILDNNLIVLSKTRLCSFNLLTGEMNELYAKVNTTSGGRNLITIDPLNKLVCLALNYYNTEPDFSIKSKILIFNPNQIKPIYSSVHNQGISSIRHFNSSFIFVDLDSRVGVVQPSNVTETEQEETFDLTSDMNNMLINAQATADVINNRNVQIKLSGINGHNEKLDDVEFNRSLDLNTFQPIFENVEGIQIETLFDRIIKVIK